jgi:hypothetical protein
MTFGWMLICFVIFSPLAFGNKAMKPKPIHSQVASSQLPQNFITG